MPIHPHFSDHSSNTPPSTPDSTPPSTPDSTPPSTPPSTPAVTPSSTENVIPTSTPTPTPTPYVSFTGIIRLTAPSAPNECLHGGIVGTDGQGIPNQQLVWQFESSSNIFQSGAILNDFQGIQPSITGYVPLSSFNLTIGQTYYVTDSVALYGTFTYNGGNSIQLSATNDCPVSQNLGTLYTGTTRTNTCNHLHTSSVTLFTTINGGTLQQVYTYNVPLYIYNNMTSTYDIYVGDSTTLFTDGSGYYGDIDSNGIFGNNTIGTCSGGPIL